MYNSFISIIYLIVVFIRNIGSVKVAFIWLVLITMVSTVVSAQVRGGEKSKVMAFSYVNKSNASKLVFDKSLTNFAKSLDTTGLETWKITLTKQVHDLGEGDFIEVPLPNGELISAEISVRKKFQNGDVQLRASIGGNGGIVLTMNEKTVFGSIVDVAGDVNMSIGMDGQTQALLVDQDTMPLGAIDFTEDMVEADEVSTKTVQAELEIMAQALTSNEKSNLDILFVYSPEFSETFGDPQARINQLVGFTNLAYDNIGVLINMRVAAAVELDIENNPSVSASLNDVKNARNGFELVPELRNQFGADLVAVLTSRDDNGANGIANVGGRNSNAAFSVTRLSPRCCDLVFAHEIGHNLGSGHERSTVNSEQRQSCTGGFTGFSCGHGSIANNWGTLMSSSSSLSRFRGGNVFSNLTSPCQGSPCGVAQGQGGAADNQSSFNITRLNVSQYRDEVSQASMDDIDTEVMPDFIVIPLNNGKTVVVPL